jgi:hypothetical protein
MLVRGQILSHEFSSQDAYRDGIRIEPRQNLSGAWADVKDDAFARCQEAECWAGHFGGHGFAAGFPEAGEGAEADFGDVEELEGSPFQENDFDDGHDEVWRILEMMHIEAGKDETYGSRLS